MKIKQLTQLSCEHTELGVYHTNMCMISGNICVEYILRSDSPMK